MTATRPSGTTELAPLAEKGSLWLASLDYADLPDDVVGATKLRIVDVVGNMIAAGRTDFARSVIRAARALAGSDGKAPGASSTSALVLGALATALDFDDTHNESMLHCSSPAAVAALVTAPLARSTGREMITAVAGGVELMSRLGLVAPGGFHATGFHATGILGSAGAAWVAGKLLGLPAGQLSDAVGMAGSQAAGLLQPVAEGADSRLLFAGCAAQTGVTAAFLAQAGINGPRRVFEAERGLFATHVIKAPAAFRHDVFDGLGLGWESRNTSFKPYPCGHVIHPCIQAALFLRREFAVRPEDIAKVTCHVPDYAVPMVCEPAEIRRAPRNDIVARVSLQFTVAEALTLGRMDARSYAKETLADPDVLALAEKVAFTADPRFATRRRFGGGVVLEMTDGRTLQRMEPANWGSADMPMTADDVRAKFMQNVQATALSANAHAMLRDLDGLDRLEAAGGLMAGLEQALYGTAS